MMSNRRGIIVGIYRSNSSKFNCLLLSHPFCLIISLPSYPCNPFLLSWLGFYFFFSTVRGLRRIKNNNSNLLRRYSILTSGLNVFFKLATLENRTFTLIFTVIILLKLFFFCKIESSFFPVADWGFPSCPTLMWQKPHSPLPTVPE